MTAEDADEYQREIARVLNAALARYADECTRAFRPWTEIRLDLTPTAIICNIEFSDRMEVKFAPLKPTAATD